MLVGADFFEISFFAFTSSLAAESAIGIAFVFLLFFFVFRANPVRCEVAASNLIIRTGGANVTVRFHVNRGLVEYRWHHL